MSSAMLSDGDLRNLQGKSLQGRYRLTRVIDWGGFGAVYEAVDEKFDDRIVAVKVAAAAASERAFAKEAKLAHKFEHPHVVKVHDYGVDTGLSFIVMELLSGVRFDTLLERYRGQLPQDMLCKFVREIGSALRKGHKNGLVHRDLKPKNVLLVEDGHGDDDQPRQRFVLLDFGIASQIDASNSLKNLTMDGAGTPEYMSPEQVQAQSVTPASDIYSFGVILYQLLAGRVPFPLPDQSHLAVAQCLTSIVRDTPPKFDEVAPDRMIDPRIEELVLQCLEKDPARRPQSVQEVRERFLNVYAPGAAGNTLDTMEPGGTMHPGLLQSGVSTSNAAGAETKPSWHGRTLRTVRRPSRTAPLLSLALLLAVGGGVAAFFLQPATGPSPGFTMSVVPGELAITAGDAQGVVISLERVQFDEPIEVALETNLERVTIEAADPADSDLRDVRKYLVRADLNAPVAAGELRVLARAGDREQSMDVPFEVRPVEGSWLPENFEPSPASRLKRVAGRVYYDRIRRTIPNVLPVEFVLVDEPGEVPFYIMENKVWNGLFAAFSEENSDYRDTRLRVVPESGWSAAARKDERLPATDITVTEAARFAQWIAGEAGDLPTQYEWDIAAGHRRWKREPEQMGAGPFQTAHHVAIDRDSPLPVDRAEADASVYNCRDMAGNGWEWTRSIVDRGQSLPDGLSILERHEHFDSFTTFVVYRGQSFAAPEPLTFTELERQNSEPLQKPIGMSNDETGFRVVIRPR